MKGAASIYHKNKNACQNTSPFRDRGEEKRCCHAFFPLPIAVQNFTSLLAPVLIHFSADQCSIARSIIQPVVRPKWRSERSEWKLLVSELTILWSLAIRADDSIWVTRRKESWCSVSRTMTHHHSRLTTTLASFTSHTHARTLTYTPRKKTVDSVWKIRDS